MLTWHQRGWLMQRASWPESHHPSGSVALEELQDCTLLGLRIDPAQLHALWLELRMSFLLQGATNNRSNDSAIDLIPMSKVSQLNARPDIVACRYSWKLWRIKAVTSPKRANFERPRRLFSGCDGIMELGSCDPLTNWIAIILCQLMHYI